MRGGRAKAEYGQRCAAPSARLRIPAAKQIALHNSVMFDEAEQGDEPPVSYTHLTLPTRDLV